VVGAAVDDDGVRRELGGDRAGRAVREGEEDDVVPGEGLRRRRCEDAVGERHEVRLVLAEGGAGVAGGGHGADLHLGVAEEEAEQLTTGVAAGARDRDRDAHGA
jgi:hypothetical protein